MLIIDPYSLLPAFTLAAFLAILLWPENIAYKSRVRFFMIILLIWVAASVAGMMGYGASDKPLTCLINMIVGLFGLIALFFAYQAKPFR